MLSRRSCTSCPARASVGITKCSTVLEMAHAISVRLDDEAERALRVLEAAGLSPSEAVRSALVDAARRRQSRSELAAECAALEADDADREEMVEIARLMESLRAPG